MAREVYEKLFKAPKRPVNGFTHVPPNTQYLKEILTKDLVESTSFAANENGSALLHALEQVFEVVRQAMLELNNQNLHTIFCDFLRDVRTWLPSLNMSHLLEIVEQAEIPSSKSKSHGSIDDESTHSHQGSTMEQQCSDKIPSTEVDDLVEKLETICETNEVDWSNKPIGSTMEQQSSDKIPSAEVDDLVEKLETICETKRSRLVKQAKKSVRYDEILSEITSESTSPSSPIDSQATYSPASTDVLLEEQQWMGDFSEVYLPEDPCELLTDMLNLAENGQFQDFPGIFEENNDEGGFW
eukprot:CAMPEP_0115029180 /NCGR_PEP_ID=MMETSP0216-20121206/36822_1 /TAXON_ID=223996 /ORGANISM="Protocruzia adherens, Strain Boccale" /LENGTH=297 /DNA_ID=CAMNT_0002405665 /DNA_START=392 /DNA_END=1285 /DNA_ORIENTATION=+